VKDEEKRKQRHALIESLLRAEEVNTQGDLVDLLKEMGYPVSQSTIARDIVEMGLYKVRGPQGRSRYVLPREEEKDAEGRVVQTLHAFCTYMDVAATNVIVHCRPGAAGPVATAVDRLQLADVAGSLAGYDTCVLFARSPEKAREVADYLDTLRTQEADD